MMSRWNNANGMVDQAEARRDHIERKAHSTLGTNSIPDSPAGSLFIFIVSGHCFVELYSRFKASRHVRGQVAVQGYTLDGLLKVALRSGLIRQSETLRP
jgi:hypothetical protein